MLLPAEAPPGGGDLAMYLVFLGAPGRNRTYDLRFRKNAVERVSASLLESHLTCSASVFSSSDLVEHHAGARGGWTSGWTTFAAHPPVSAGSARHSKRL